MTTSIDAFGRQRVSNNHILLSGQLNHADNPLIWDEALVGGATATYDADESTVELATGTADADKATRQTKRYYLYRAGQSQSIKMTFADMAGVANVTKEVGYFDDNDGIFLEVTESAVNLVLRSSVTGVPVETRVPRAQWERAFAVENLDFSKAQHMRIDLQWLGVGRVRVDFNVGGEYVNVHTFSFANVITGVPYMKMASLPCRYQITNTAASAGATMKQICCSVEREGGDEEEGIPTAIRSDVVTPLTATNVARSAISLRLRSSHIRAFALPRLMELLNLGAIPVAFDLILNPTLTGSLVWLNTGQAGLQWSVTQLNYTALTGHVIASGVVDSTNQTKGQAKALAGGNIGIAADIAGVSDILSIIVQADAAGPANIVAMLQVLELF